MRTPIGGIPFPPRQTCMMLVAGPPSLASLPVKEMEMRGMVSGESVKGKWNVSPCAHRTPFADPSEPSALRLLPAACNLHNLALVGRTRLQVR